MSAAVDRSLALIDDWRRREIETNDAMALAPRDLAERVESALIANPTESNLALAFTGRMGGKLLYCGELGGWLEWTGTHWKRDKLQRAFNYCVDLARSLNSGGKTIGKASFAAGVERIAAAEPAFARLAEEFDVDRDLIATRDGTVNLRTGLIYQARQDDMITRLAGTAPASGAPRRWLEFLKWAFDGDEERIGFLQEWMGYSLSGHTGAEIFVYLDGPGGNGKGCITSIMSLIGGDYHHTAPPNLLLYSPMPTHPTSLAALNSKRLVVASELPAMARLDEQKLKMLTGGDTVRARFTHCDEIEFRPELKLTVATNHPPRIIRPDEAMHRRLRVLTMPKKPEHPDPSFKSAVLPSEAGQIMAWAMEGAARVLGNNEVLSLPAKVAEDRDAYLGSQDAIGQFLEEKCDLHASVRLSRTEMYNAYQEWADEAGETFTMPAREFYGEVEKRGFRAGKVAGIRMFSGVSLKPKSGVFHD